MSKPMAKLRRQLRRCGFKVTKLRGGHWRFEHPDMIVFVSADALETDTRAIRNLPDEIRRKMKS